MAPRRIKAPGRPARTSTTPAESPRARLKARGSAALSDAEVIGLLLRTGGRESAALRVPQDLLDDLGGLNGLLGTSAGRLRRKGIGEARTSVLLAAMELARRLAHLKLPPRKPMGRPGYVAAYLALRYFVPDQEVMGAMFVDVRNRLIADREFFRGTLHGARGYAAPADMLARDRTESGRSGIASSKWRETKGASGANKPGNSLPLPNALQRQPTSHVPAGTVQPTQQPSYLRPPLNLSNLFSHSPQRSSRHLNIELF